MGQSTSLRFCEVCVILCAICTMAADLKTTYFQGQMHELVGECLERDNLHVSKLKSVFEGMFLIFK